MPNDNKIELEHLLMDYPILLEPFKNADPALKKNLLQEVDESSFSLADWLDALGVLYKWLDKDGLVLLPEHGLGYVSCAAKSVSSNSTYIHLPSLVQDFLEQYGCELAVKK